MPKIYKGDLLSITENIIVNQNKTREENILRAETQVVKHLLVQPTISKKIFKEIITGIKIPIRFVDYFLDTDNYPIGDLYHHTINSPVFIDNRTDYYYGKAIQSLQMANYDEIKNYMQTNFKEDLTKELNHIFELAYKYYNDAENSCSKSYQKTLTKI